MKRALIVVLLCGCAAGDDAVRAEPANDAQVDVPLVEVSNEETSADASADAGADASADAGADASADADARADATADTPPTVWSHTITIDGTNDFTDTEKLPTTTVGYDAFLTWDAASFYFGMSGADIGTTPSPTKWVFLYFDGDPGTSTGALTSEKYNTQQAKFPTGFGAEFYLRWKTDDSFFTIQKWDGVAWTTVTSVVDHKRTASFVEFRIPRATVGSPTAPGIVSYMINEQNTLESTYAGLYASNFTDGYAVLKPLTKYQSADASDKPPNAASRIKP